MSATLTQGFQHNLISISGEKNTHTFKHSERPFFFSAVENTVERACCTVREPGTVWASSRRRYDNEPSLSLTVERGCL